MRRVTALVLVLTALAAACSSSIPSTHRETTVALNQGVYFTGPDGTQTLVSPGTYRVAKGSTETLRLQSVTGGSGTEVLAVKTTHGTNVDGPQAAYFDESDEVRRIVLMMPERQGLEAWGSTTEMRTRGGGGSAQLRLDRLMQQREELQQQIEGVVHHIEGLHQKMNEFADQIPLREEERSSIEQQLLALNPDDPESEAARILLEEQLGEVVGHLENLELEVGLTHEEILQTEQQLLDLHQQMARLDQRIMMLMQMIGG